MEKPITLRRREMIEKVCDAINESALPAFVIRDALKAIDADLARAQEEQYNRDLQEWTVYKMNQAKTDSKGVEKEAEMVAEKIRKANERNRKTGDVT